VLSNLVFELHCKLFVQEIDLIFLVEDDYWLFKIVKHKFVFALLLNFDKHVVENFNVQAGTHYFKYYEAESSE